MNTITTANKNRILGGQKQLVNIVCLLKNGTTITLTEANIMENSLVIDRATSYGDTMFIGSATASQLSFTVADFNGTYETTDFHDARMDVTLCLDISGTRTAVLPMGRFYVLTAKRDLKQIQIVALDQLTLLDSISDRAGSGGFTVTLANILQNVSSKVFGNTTTIDFSAVNSLCTSPSMTKFQYPSGKDVTYHNIVAWVAALTGTIARAHGNGGTGSIQLIRSSASGDTITKATRFSGKCEENDVALTGVFAVDASGKEYSVGSVGYQLNITSNGIFEQAYNQDTNADFRQTLLTRLWSNMGALTVRPFKATTLSYPWLECGDTVTYVDDKGVSHSAIVTHIRFVLNGRMQLDCELPSTEEQTIDTALPPSIKRSTITTEMLRINAIKSLNYVEANGNFSSAGTWFDLARGLIKSKNFAIDANGNAYFKGTITATAGYIGTESNGFAIGSSDLTGTYTVGNESYTIKVETDGTITMRPVTFSTNSTYTSTNLDEASLRMSAYHPDIGYHDQIDIYSTQDGMGIGFFVGNNEITDATTAEEFAINGQHRTSLGGIYASPENGAITTDGKWILSPNTYLDGHSGQTLKDWIDAIEASGYVLPAATTSALGGVIVGSNLSVTANGTLSVNTGTIATRSWVNSQGFIKSVAWGDVTSKPFVSIGSGLEVDANNILHAKVGNGLKIDSDADNGIAVDLTASDIPSLTASKISDFTSSARSAISATTPISYASSTGKITHATSLSSAVASGLYKIAANTYGHITSATAVAKADITALGIPAQDTTYSAGTGVDISSSHEVSVLYGDGLTLDDGNSIEVDFTTVAKKTDIPTVNNATLTIQRNGTTVKTFTANASSNVTANITVPTKTSDLTNDSGFITGITWTGVSSKPFNTVGDGLEVDTNKILKVKAGNGIKIDSDADNGVAVDLSASDIPTLTSAKISDFDSAVDTALGIGTGSTFLRKDGTWVTPTGTVYSAGDGITVDGTIISAKYGTGLTTDGNDALAVDTTTIALKSDIKTYTAGTGIAISSANAISNSGVRAVTINGNNLRVNTNGTNADLTIPYATSAGSAPASDVYAWAKAATKPTYTATEVGALPISGGRMSGNITWTNSSLPVFSDSPTYLLGIEAFASGGATKYARASNVTVGTASKITGNTIALGTAVTSTATTFTGASAITIPVNSVKEAYLSWGGKNFAASFGVIDAAMIPDFGANRFAFLKADGITVEYSTDAGSSWTDYGLTDGQKSGGIFAVGTNVYLGKHTSAGSGTINDQLRIIINTSLAQIYTQLNKFAIYITTRGATVLCKIESATHANPTVFSDILDWTEIRGDGGWNVLNVSAFTTYGNSNSQHQYIRIIFKVTTTPSANYPSPWITRIMAFGGMGWSTPSNMAKNGHLYSYDASQNATFPAKINGYTLAAACAKGVDTSISASSTSVNLPTSKAVATFVEGKGYITSIPTATTNVIGGVKVPSGSGLSISSGSLGLNIGTGLDVDNNNNLVVSLSASNIPTITSSKISDFTSAAKTAIGIASSGSTFLRKDGTWASPTVSSIAWSSVTSKPFTSVNESGGLEIVSNALQVRPGTGLVINDDSGELQVNTSELTKASTSSFGIMKVGTGLSASSGTVSVNTANCTKASTSAFGVMKVGTNLVASGGVVSLAPSIDERITALEQQICLIEGTKIAMADGSEKNIEDVKVGDMVLSYNPSTGKQIEAMALKSVRTGVAKDFDVFVFDNGNVAEMFQEHSVYDVNLGYPHSHKEWKVGDVGLMVDGEQSALARITTARHAIIKQRFVLCTSTGLYYANGILMGIWSSTKYNIVSRPCYNLNLPDKILNEFKRCGEMNDKANLLEINPDFIKQAKPIQQTIHRLSTEIEEAKKNLTDTDYLVAKFTEGLISTAEWLKSKASRANWRTIINNDESPLAEAKEQLENLKARIKGQVPSLKENYWESVAESDKLLPEFKAWYAEWSKANEEIN